MRNRLTNASAVFPRLRSLCSSWSLYALSTRADLNPSFVDELDCSQASVTALQFARFVSRNRPVVLRGLGHTLQIPALQRWTSTEHLVGKLGGEKQLRIAATPEGNADAIVDGVFVEPACTWLPAGATSCSTQSHTDASACRLSPQTSR